MDRVSQAVKDLVEEIQRMPEAPDPAETDRHAFTLLLSGIAACRRAPGDTVPHGVPDPLPVWG